MGNTQTTNSTTKQLSLFDELMKVLQKDGAPTSQDLTKAIETLKKAKASAKAREKEAAARQARKEFLEQQQEERRKEKEHVAQVTSMDLPLDWENLFAGDPRAEGVHADSISDGLILSLSNLGRVDMEYISSITGADLKTVISTLKGSVYQNPATWEECFYKGWETACM